MLAAAHGDALLIEYGRVRTRRMIIDGGPLHTYPHFEDRLKRLPQGDQRVELLVITHVDTDHIEGIIRLLALPESRWPIDPQEIWFNGWRHLEEARDLGGREGELISALIHKRALERWNTKFGGKAVRVGGVPGDRITLADDMIITLLSPDTDALEVLMKDWKEHAQEWEIDPGNLDQAWEQLVEATKFHPDSELTLGPGDLTDTLRRLLKGKDPSKANRSSIAFIAEHYGKSCMFLGDAVMSVVCGSLERLGATKDRPVRVDAVKLSHHGSIKNITPNFFELVEAKHYLVSSNGDRHHHPDPEAIEAIIQGARVKPTIWFNYRSQFTTAWEAGSQGANALYQTRYPHEGQEGIVLEL